MAEIYRGHFLQVDGGAVRRLAEVGTISSENMYSQRMYSQRNESILEINNLWGLFDDYETQTEVSEAIKDDIAQIVGERSGGVLLAFQFYPSNYFFTKKSLRKPEDIQGAGTGFDDYERTNPFRCAGTIPRWSNFVFTKSCVLQNARLCEVMHY